METKADGEVQSKDLAFAAAASTNDCSNCCIQRMTDCIPPASSFLVLVNEIFATSIPSRAF